MVSACDVPSGALLARYLIRPGCYVDCFETTVTRQVSLAQFIAAFYTTRLFRLEWLVLALNLRRRIADAEVAALAQGAESFAAWRVKDRRRNEILLSDQTGRTRSFLAVQDAEDGNTRLLFGSAVVPAKATGTDLGTLFRLLLPVHRVYSSALLAAARRNIG